MFNNNIRLGLDQINDPAAFDQCQKQLVIIFSLNHKILFASDIEQLLILTILKAWHAQSVITNNESRSNKNNYAQYDFGSIMIYSLYLMDIKIMISGWEWKNNFK